MVTLAYMCDTYQLKLMLGNIFTSATSPILDTFVTFVTLANARLQIHICDTAWAMCDCKYRRVTMGNILDYQNTYVTLANIRLQVHICDTGQY